LSFDTLNVKFAWYVDQNNMTSTLQSAFPFAAKPPKMYTTPHHSGTINNAFDWTTLPDGGDVAGDGYRHYYDTPSTTSLNVQLSGDVNTVNPWTWTGSEALDTVTGIYYYLGYPQVGQVQQFVNGGTYTQQTNSIDLHSNPYSFITNDPNYTIPNQTNAAPVYFDPAVVATSGYAFSYPGIATSSDSGGGFLQVLNAGSSVLFEMWYSRMSY
jgi:hypothetical protein